MDSFDLQSAQQICTECRKIGEVLEQPAITQIVSEAEDGLRHPSKLRIAFISANFNSASKALQEVYGIRPLPEGMGNYEVATSAKIIYSQAGQDDSAGAECLKENDGQYVSLGFVRESEMLGQIDAEILYSISGFTDFDWKKELAEIDYAFLVVNALQMLTSAERDFVGQYITKYFGLARFAVILADAEMVNSQESYQELRSRLDWYLDSLGRECIAYELDTGELKPFVCDRLLQDKEQLRNLAAYMTASRCYEEAKEAVLAMSEAADIDISEIENCFGELKRREEKMRRRGHIAANSVRSELMGTVQYNVSQATRKLFGQMCGNICDAIDQSADLEQTKENIPRFMETAIQQLGSELQKGIDAETKEMAGKLEEQMRADAGEFFTEIPVWKWISRESDITAQIQPEVFELSETGTEAAVNKLSKTLLIGTVPILIFGSIPLAVGTLVGSQLVKKMSKDKVEAESKEALKKVVQDLCDQQEQDIKEALKQKLLESAEQAEKGVEDAYSGFISAVMNELVQQKENAERASAKKEVIVHILNTDLPKIEQNLLLG